MFFIDESGSIPKTLDKRYKHRYFVISFVHTDNPKKLKNVYKRGIESLKKYFPEFFNQLENPGEMKASEALPFMKSYLIEKLIKNTDIKIGYMVVDTTKIEDSFRRLPSRSFNYLVKIVMENFPYSIEDNQELILNIDNRNSAVESLKSLEDYLYTELVLHLRASRNVTVSYMDSKSNYNIQIADLIANVIYQRFRYKRMNFPNFKNLKNAANEICPFTYEYIFNQLQSRVRMKYIFPYSMEFQREAAAGIKL